MNIESLQQNTFNKIYNDNYNFTPEDVAILSTNNVLFLYLVKKIYTNQKALDDNFSLILDLFENAEPDKDFSMNKLEQFIPFLETKYYDNMLYGKNITIDAIKMASSRKYFDNVIDAIKTRNDYYKIIVNNNERDDFNIIINNLMIRKEYFVIEKILKNCEMWRGNKITFERFIKEFPFNEYNLNIADLIPFMFKFNLDEIIHNNLDKLNFSSLCGFYNRELDSTNKSKILDVISKKLNNKDVNFNYTIPPSFDENDVELELITSNGKKLMDVIKEKFNKEINLNNLSIILNVDIELTKEQIELVCKLIRESNLELSLHNKYIINNDDVLNALIDSGNYDNLNYNIQKNKKEYFENVVYNAYKNNDFKILNKTKLNLCNKYHVDIIKKFIEEKYFDLFILNNDGGITSSYDNKNFFPEIMNYILNTNNEELGKSELINIIRYHSFEYIEKLVEYEQYEKISYIPFDLTESMIKNKKNCIIKLIKNNFVCACKLMKEHYDVLLKIEECRNIFLSYKYSYFNNKIITFLSHAENDSLYNANVYKSIKKLFIDKYNLNEKHLDSMVNKYGYLLIKYIENDSIIKMINLEDDKFNKMLNLFNVKPFKMNDMETIYDSFKQEEFCLKYSDIVNIFPNIMHSLESSSDISNYLSMLELSWNDTLKSKIVAKYPEEEPLLDDYYLNYVGKMLYNEDAPTKDKYVKILHIITDYYIANNREYFRKTYDMYDELNIPYGYDEKDLEKNTLILKLQESIIFNMVNEENLSNIYVNLIKELVNNGLSYGEACDSLLLAAQKNFVWHIKQNQYSLNQYLCYKYKDQSFKVISEIQNKIEKLNKDENLKKNIGLVYKVAKDYLAEYRFHIIKNNIYLDKDDCKHLKRKYYLKRPSLNIFELISNIRMDLVVENLLENDEAYNALKRVIEKYKLDNLSKSVDNILSKEIYDLSCCTSDISTFISFFHNIYETEKSKLEVQGKSLDNFTISIMNIFKYLDKYASVSSIYSQILGKEDEGLIRSNPKPNSATGISKEERLNRAVKKTFENFNKKVVKVPTFNHNITLKNGKLITAIVGNFTKPTNLTHGERTGACMRIGGVGYTLFDSQDIFHIEFNDSKTDKYISRVTGFRNGNTVFLNELRYSCDSSLYTNNEVVEACKIVAQELIDRSKDSEAPIDNVVIHRDYAMLCTEDDRVVLNINNNKKGLSSFYSDVSNYVQVLATNAGKENTSSFSNEFKSKFVHVNLDNSKVPDYLPSREKIRSGSGKVIVEQINRLYTISLALKGKSFFVNPLVTSIVYGYVGEDWYVFIDDNNKIVSERIDRDERSIIEYEFAKEEINKYLNNMNSEVKHAI